MEKKVNEHNTKCSISEDDIECLDWVQCKVCKVNVLKDDLNENSGICPSCFSKIEE